MLKNLDEAKRVVRHPGTTWVTASGHAGKRADGKSQYGLKSKEVAQAYVSGKDVDKDTYIKLQDPWYLKTEAKEKPVEVLEGKSLLKIGDEIIKVNLVGVGATNTLNVVRGFMGTVAAAHTVGASVTALSGDYRIDNGKIHFSEAPYGPAGICTFVTTSSFSGR